MELDGSGRISAQSLVRLGLVDEYRVLVRPLALGRGLPLFAARTAPPDLVLVDVRPFAAGAVAHVYRPRR